MKKRMNNSNGNYAAYNGTIPTQNLKEMPSTAASYDVSYDTDTKAKTAYNTIRNYDVTVDKIDLKIAGAAPIFGERNRAQLLSWRNDIKANYTGSLNNLYAYNQMRTVGLAYREVEVNYQGIDVSQRITPAQWSNGNAATGEPYANNIALRRWNSSVSVLIGELEAAIYRDLPINDIAYSTAAEFENHIPGYRAGLSPLACALYQYQQELIAYMSTLLQFQYLVALLPKLAELYPQYAPFFNYVQNQLKTTRYTSLVRSVMMSLKRRFVDKKFFRDFILPTSVYSQETDGINSPILYLLNNQTLLNVGFTMNDQTTYSRLNTYAVNWSQTTDGYLVRKLDAFTLDTLMELVLSQNFNNPGNLGSNAQIQQYLQRALATLQLLNASVNDFGNNQIVIALETALNKLNVAPGTQSLQWTTNIDFSEMVDITRLDRWEAVETIMFHAVYPVQVNNNGFVMRVPMYRRTGFSKQLMLEYFQVFYANIPERFISFVRIYDKLTTRLRNRSVVSYRWTISENNTDHSAWVVSSITSYDGSTNAQADYMRFSEFMTTFSDKFVSVLARVDKEGTTSIVRAVPNPIPSGAIIAEMTNPDLMGFVDYSIVNRASEIDVELMRNFIIPLA